MIKKIRINNGAATNSILLTFVSVVTTGLGMIISKLLSVHFSLYEYGTYSQLMLISTTVTSVTSLGLANATNYFYNKSKRIEEQQQYVSTLVIIQEAVGFLCGVMIYFFREPIAAYFGNIAVKNLILIVAFMPLFSHLITTYQNLFVSIGKAKIIAIRNLVVSSIRLASVVIACFYIHDIKVILIVILGLDVVQLIYFRYAFGKDKMHVSLKFFSPSLIKGILLFSIPLSVYAVSGNLNNDLDKYVIGFFTDTDTLAIYSNASKRLPFDIITISFMTILIPIMTRLLNSEQTSEAKDLFSAYIRLGCIVSIICGGGCIAFSKPFMLLLYDPKYLPGHIIFIIYIIIEMIRFANVTIVLSATGQTKIIMFVSLGTLVLNGIFSVVSYKIIGLYGPAIVTLILSAVSTGILLHFGSKTLKCSILSLFRIKEMLMIGIEAVILGIIMNWGTHWLERYISIPEIFVLFELIIYGAVLLLMNKKTVINYIANINQYGKE